MAKISSELFGVLTANNRVPSVDFASGRTWPLSNVMKSGDCASDIAGPKRSAASIAARLNANEFPLVICYLRKPSWSNRRANPSRADGRMLGGEVGGHALRTDGSKL